MVKIILSGCSGYMGRVVTALVDADPEVSIIAGIDLNVNKQSSYPVFVNSDDIAGDPDTSGFLDQADCIIDFSAPSALDGLFDLALSKQIPVILCATGYSPEQLAEINKVSKRISVFRSGNMSLGINLLAELIKRACTVLGEDFDVEIIERHHRRKVDAPSGTALMLADAAAAALPYDPEYIYERESRREPRGKRDIGISSVRGGTVVGVHDVIFSGTDEVLELRHTAASRDIFAAGALKAAKFMINKPPGLYDMNDVLAQQHGIKNKK